LPEKVIRQKADAIGEQTEQQAHQEMSHGLRIMAAQLKAGGELGKLRRRRFGNARSGALWAELFRIGEGVSQNI
jgi:hypothetical protein